MPRPDTLQLGALLHGSGGDVAGRRHPDADAPGELGLAHHARLARTLEDAGFAAILIADGGLFEPFTLLAALSSVTARIGLVAPATASSDEPFTVARKLASLDHLSHGRAGWSVVTPGHADAARAAEFVDVVEGLWDGVEAGAMVRDKASGIYLDRTKRHPLDHDGEHFRVAGPLNIARPPQGRPVLLQADASETGSAFAARCGEVLVTVPRSLQEALADRTALDAQLAAIGRDPGDVRVWPRLSPIVVDTDAEAAEVHADLGSEDVPRPVVGSAGAIADRLASWHASGAVDGFTVSFPLLPGPADRFVAEVLPLLQERGVFRPPAPGTLREQLGLPAPTSGSAARA